MSKWRVNGYVQDSDEEDEDSDLELSPPQSIQETHYASSERVEHVEHAQPTAETPRSDENETSAKDTLAEFGEDTKEEIIAGSPQKDPGQQFTPARPTVSPITSPARGHSPMQPIRQPAEIFREPTESPDPLQALPSPQAPHYVKLEMSSQSLGRPVSSQTAVTQHMQSDNGVSTGNRRLSNFGIHDDLSSADALSGPPSDLERRTPAKVVFGSPKRRTEVQVIIPPSTAPHIDYREEQSRRSLRERRPIQMHPYLLEGERYRMELQGRGIKPVSRVKSPVRQPVHDDAETQDREFEPEIDFRLSSPVDDVVSTPIVPRTAKDSHETSIHRPRSITKTQRPTVIPLAKRRKLYHGLPQPRTIGSHEHSASNVWNIPPSPPNSSSPLPNNTASALRKLPRPAVTTPARDIPTPSLSSSLQGDAQAGSDSDGEPVTRGVHRSVKPLRLLTMPSDLSSSDTDPPSGSEPSETEYRRVGKKIRGVLPASWVQLNKPGQDKSKLQAKDHFHDARSPEKAGPQRGVAQKVVKKKNSTQRPTERSEHSPNPIVISDSSDTEVDMPVHRTMDFQKSAQAASDMAAMFDRQYADVDSEDMEDDRLDLFPSGGTRRKRKAQTKLTDAFFKTKKPKMSKRGTKLSSNPQTRVPDKNRHLTYRRARRTPPPELSVLDIDISPSRPEQDLPDFLKVARRQARRRPDLARERLTHKHIRLHTAHETQDANVLIQQWRNGALKPRPNAGIPSSRPVQRDPLSHLNNNQQRNQPPSASKQPSDSGTAIQKHLESPHAQPVHSGFQRRNTGPHQSTPASSKKIRKKRHPVKQNLQPYRAAQLEGLETSFGSSDHRFSFAKRLQQVNLQYRLQLSTGQTLQNPPLARFLAAANATLPPLPSAKDVGEQETESPVAQPRTHERRLIRKAQARRIDADTREYRQPSEPALGDLFNDAPVEEVSSTSVQELKQPILQGLGPHGTRYTTTFDTGRLKSDTYFHVSTFVGGGELSRALQKDDKKVRNLDEPAGYAAISHNKKIVRCGPWDDTTFAQLLDLINTIWHTLGDQISSEDDQLKTGDTALQHTTELLRHTISYIAHHLSFLDPIDRQTFVTKMKQLIESLFEHARGVDIDILGQGTVSARELKFLRTMTYLLVVSMQVRQIAHHPLVDRTLASALTNLVHKISKLITTRLLRRISHFSAFLERNKLFAERENGIQDSEVLIESLVVCMHVLSASDIPMASFWDLVAQELLPQAEQATHFKTFESVWGVVFTLLPYVELDDFGILKVNGRASFRHDNWTLIKMLLKRMFTLYPQTNRMCNSSLNDYVRASLTRCHVLIQYWHWHRCDPALSEMFDFFAKNGLRLLNGERQTKQDGRGSAKFLEDLARQPSLDVSPNDNAFQIYLKCLALGLRAMPSIYQEKKIRSIVFRLTPNHGRSYPKDQGLDPKSLDALGNHHDLLCTLYWASPPSCRPKLELIRGLVHHGSSHHAACSLNVLAWANMTAFQLSTKEPEDATRPFAEWHKEMMQQSLTQYQLAKTEADTYIRAGVLDDLHEASDMVQYTMKKNQKNVITTLRGCIKGMRKAVETSMERVVAKEADHATVRTFLATSGLVELLELLHFQDTRLVEVIRDTLGVLRSYASLGMKMSNCTISQSTSDETQDYGDSLDLADFAHLDQQCVSIQPNQPTLAFIEDPLWRLLSNAFGAESAPDDNLLMECIDTWALVSSCQVSMGARSWSHYLTSLSHSWQQLRQTKQTQTFAPYFMEALILCDSNAYTGHETEFTTALFSCLADRESILRFQHRLLKAMIQIDPAHSLLKNLPFFLDENTGKLDINAENVRARRLGLISSLLANMRDEYHATMRENSQRVKEVRAEYTMVLQTFMKAMKNNYEQLGQTSTVTGAYVEFVQKVVQFLQQYTTDVCPVLGFFTNSVTFPLPATDPTYVVGRLCGYAPKLSEVGVQKQLSVSVETIAQQAAAGSQHVYLVDQLTRALSTNVAPLKDRIVLRDALLQGVFPAYIEAAFTSTTGLSIAMPILKSLGPILQAMKFDIHIHDESSVRRACETIMSIVHAFIRSSERLKDHAALFKEPYILHATSLMLASMTDVVPLVEYIYGRYLGSSVKPTVVRYFEQLNMFIANMLHGIAPHRIPSYHGDANKTQGTYAALLTFSRDGLQTGIRKNWSINTGRVLFGHGRAQKEINVGIESIRGERARVISRIEGFYATVASLYGKVHGDGGKQDEMISLGSSHI
jgi:hypothetical protein